MAVVEEWEKRYSTTYNKHFYFCLTDPKKTTWYEPQGPHVRIVEAAADVTPGATPRSTSSTSWKREWSEEYGRHYFYDTTTGATQWETPAGWMEQQCQDQDFSNDKDNPTEQREEQGQQRQEPQDQQQKQQPEQQEQKQQVSQASQDQAQDQAQEQEQEQDQDQDQPVQDHGGVNDNPTDRPIQREHQQEQREQQTEHTEQEQQPEQDTKQLPLRWEVCFDENHGAYYYYNPEFGSTWYHRDIIRIFKEGKEFIPASSGGSRSSLEEQLAGCSCGQGVQPASSSSSSFATSGYPQPTLPPEQPASSSSPSSSAAAGPKDRDQHVHAAGRQPTPRTPPASSSGARGASGPTSTDGAQGFTSPPARPPPPQLPAHLACAAAAAATASQVVREQTPPASKRRDEAVARVQKLIHPKFGSADDQSVERLYHVLGLEPSASPTEAREAFRALALLLHPDKRHEEDQDAKRAGDEAYIAVKAAFDKIKLRRP
eukprot:CAMPEP_0178469362 /NCGR_PEP_ID=MMETSP0689_2-20121128/53389_1 /TAXON_ID=160604 /ORGANISM="Amphidinium massartii, Strain CS-259" /LENGTH=485 /DNA_ID=CAMNT_0020096433 /DNA_START=239 /DNA_END=1696 /DNA_ORIENTATION=-